MNDIQKKRSSVEKNCFGKKEKSKNKLFFRTPSHEMAWTMGVIASIGTISKKRNTIKIGVDASLPTSESVLLAIKEYLSLETPIAEYVTHNGTSVISLTWTCAEHKKDLAFYGITAEKSSNLEPPYDLDKKYWRSYLSGFVNGSELFYPQYKGKIVSANVAFLTNLFDGLGDVLTLFKDENGGKKGEDIFVVEVKE